MIESMSASLTAVIQAAPSVSSATQRGSPGGQFWVLEGFKGSEVFPTFYAYGHWKKL